jgi:hypothetical protein
VEANSTGGQGSRRAVVPSDDDDDDNRKVMYVRPHFYLRNYRTCLNDIYFKGYKPEVADRR